MITLARRRGSGSVQRAQAQANNAGAPCARIVPQGIVRCVALSALWFSYGQRATVGLPIEILYSSRANRICLLQGALRSQRPRLQGSALEPATIDLRRQVRPYSASIVPRQFEAPQ